MQSLVLIRGLARDSSSISLTKPEQREESKSKSKGKFLTLTDEIINDSIVNVSSVVPAQ